MTCYGTIVGKCFQVTIFNVNVMALCWLFGIIWSCDIVIGIFNTVF